MQLIRRCLRLPALRLPALLLPALLLQGCLNLPDSIREELRCAPPDHYGNGDCETAPRWRGLPVRQSQVIVIEPDTAQSFVLGLLAQQYLPYTHAGLVVIDDGQPYVYESFAFYKPRLSGRPTRDPGGGVRRVTLASFLRRAGTIAIHEPPRGVDREAVAAFARASVAAATPFDEFFDARDPGAMYCAEFVARALEAGGAVPYAGVPVSANPSVAKLLQWFEVRAPRLVLAGEVLHGSERRLLIDARKTRVEVATRMARREELHRRFTRDQRLGNVVRWNGHSLQWRPAVARYLAAAPDSGRDARQLADLMLGTESRAPLAVAASGPAQD